MTDYAFEGGTIRLNRKDYNRWEKQFHAIPDFEAYLFTLDLYYTEERVDKNKWFVRCATACRKEHDRQLIAQRPKEDRPPHERPYETWTDDEKRDVATWVATNGREAAKRSRYLKSDIQKLIDEGWLQPRKVG